ncbi:MAG: hypothetical protein SA339_05540 [Methanomassiliicoccus sp.]|nr:hypothetical protein [Methanomassiliicoccus sp.]
MTREISSTVLAPVLGNIILFNSMLMSENNFFPSREQTDSRTGWAMVFKDTAVE